ncbi:MAG: von Willebrand factor type A domain-containing protein [Planctomycetota bacterium]
MNKREAMQPHPESHESGPELTRYLLGEATGEERREIENHLSTCASCRNELALLRTTVEMVAKLDGEEVLLNEQAKAHVMKAARTARPTKKTVPTVRVLRLSLYAAALAASVLAIVMAWDLIEGRAPMAGRELARQDAAPAAERQAPAQPRSNLRLFDSITTPSELRLGRMSEPPAPNMLSETAQGGQLRAEIEKLESLGYTEAKSEEPNTVLHSYLVQEGQALEGLASTTLPGRGVYAQQLSGIQKATAGGGETTSSVAPKAAASAAPAPPEALSTRPAGPVARGAQDGRARTLRLEEKSHDGATPAAGEARRAKGAPRGEAAAEGLATGEDAALGLLERDKALGEAPVDAPLPPEPSAGDAGDDAPSVGETRDEESLAKERVARQIEEIYRSLARRPGETPRDMFFRYWGDNPFEETLNDPLSTFAVDVDRASYTLARRYLTGGHLPPREQVRTEEFVNYFKSELSAPEHGAFRIHAQLAPSPFAHEEGYQLLKVGLKGREIDRSQRRSCALTFVIDVSGSMRQDGRLELVKQSLSLLVDQLDEGDSIGIVAFNTNGFEVLQPVAASEKEPILTKIASLAPDGSTNAGEGLRLGYAMASRQLRPGANNRVILCSDGVANTGVTDQAQMLQQVDSHRRQGIVLTCVGVGMGNHNDTLLEQLADNGDGQCFYVDRLEEARRVFVDELTGTLQTIARDVKIQVAFNPERVIRYRLLGYENRAVADRDFRNDAVDAGEVGAGHEVVALYEIKCRPEVKENVADIRLRYKDVDLPAEVTEIHREVLWDELVESFDAASPRFQLSAVAAEFAELLRRSYWASGNSFESLLPRAECVAQSLPADKDVAELAALIRQARDLRANIPDDVAQTLHEIMDTSFQITLLEEKARSDERAALDDLRRQNETLRSRLEEILLRRAGH